MSEDEHDDGFDNVPLHHKRPFGSGLRRNEIKFVPASSSLSSVDDLNSADAKPKGQSISDFYLNMVLKNSAASSEPRPSSSSHVSSRGNTKIEEEEEKEEICEICSLPITPINSTNNTTKNTNSRSHRHESSIAHQVCLTHSHPPSALDRTRMGLSVLESQGWDPDARRGLGASGQGTQYPIKVKPKDDNLGIGVVVPKDFGGGARVKQKVKERPKLLDAKKVRKMAAEDRKRADKLQRELFGRVDLEKYLGKGA